jgi:predicted transcriptional regulator
VAILAPHVLSTRIALWAAEVAGRACPVNPTPATVHVVELLRAANAGFAIERGLADIQEDRFADEETIAAISRKARTTPVDKSAR